MTHHCDGAGRMYASSEQARDAVTDIRAWPTSAPVARSAQLTAKYVIVPNAGLPNLSDFNSQR